MAKTRRQISADARIRKKNNKQRLLTKYIPSVYHAEVNEMLADTSMIPNILVYYNQLVDSKVNLPWSKVVVAEEEETSFPIKESLDESQLNPQSTSLIADSDQIASNIEESGQHQPASNNSLIGKEYLDTGNKDDSLNHPDTTIEPFEKFILDQIKDDPTISTRRISRLAAKAGFAKINSKTNLPGTKVGTDRVTRVRKKYLI